MYKLISVGRRLLGNRLYLRVGVNTVSHAAIIGLCLWAFGRSVEYCVIQ